MNKAKRILKHFDLIRSVIAIIIALLIATVVIFFVSDTPFEAIKLFLFAPITNIRYFKNVIEVMIPLMFTGVGISLMLKVNVFNLAGEGIFYMGGLAAAIVACLLDLPAIVHPLVALLAGAVAGGLISFIPSGLYVKYKSSIIVSSLMLNYIVFKFGDYILKYFLRDPNVTHVVSYRYQDTAFLPKITGNIHIGIIIVILVIILCSIFLYKTKKGYELRVVGENPEFAKYSGMNVNKTILLAQIVGGMIIGLGGAAHIIGTTTTFNWEWRSNYGWDGLVVAIIARYNPKLIPVGALILAYFRVGADVMSRSTDVQNEVISLIQGVIIILVVAAGFLEKYKHQLVIKESQQKEEVSL